VIPGKIGMCHEARSPNKRHRHHRVLHVTDKSTTKGDHINEARYRGEVWPTSMASIYELRGSRKQAKSLARESQSYRPQGNKILAALPPAEYRLLRPYLRLVPLTRGKVLWEPNQPIESVNFPNSGMISLLAVMVNGETVEVGITGREGFVGAPVLLGVQSAPFRAVVTIEGHAFQIQPDVLRKILPETPHLEGMLYRYMLVHAMQAAQAAACNCLHKIGERLSCLLAICRRTAGSDSLPFTQEFLAEMLGCRRSSVTAEINSLERAGTIRCRRGRVHVVNRGELERRACECYETVRRLSEHLRSKLIPPSHSFSRSVRYRTDKARPEHKVNPRF
jgi:CRP-like cAMP-binding protein